MACIDWAASTAALLVVAALLCLARPQPREVPSAAPARHAVLLPSLPAPLMPHPP